ncbi:hypothetical protein AURDEDRAFT_178401 [Auricularia subglabra TFB-10046 SS5]|uniref:Uncharacterized protein n=1 Tax=Auricularia subglabra (strain TFB-10046 / SS5) TaxID=717982 RepID=J0CQN4_AURST|nr:hypothetical protein AURDEDRAFT_178401 [Auricularia subglabra TFB-10046 SS5]
MLDALARTLTGRPFVPCGAPPYDAPARVNGAGAKRDTSAGALKLALEILGRFDFIVQELFILEGEPGDSI